MSNKEYQFGGYLFCTVNLEEKKKQDFTARYISKHTNNPPTENQFEIHNDYLICIPSFTWVLKIARKRCETDFYILFSPVLLLVISLGEHLN